MSLSAKDDSLFNPLARFGCGDVFTLKHNIAVDVDPLPAPAHFFDPHVDNQTGEGIHKGGFPGTVGTDHADQLAFTHVQGQVIDRQRVFKENH